MLAATIVCSCCATRVAFQIPPEHIHQTQYDVDPGSIPAHRYTLFVQIYSLLSPLSAIEASTAILTRA